MSVRSFQFKVVLVIRFSAVIRSFLVHAGLGPLLMSARRGRRFAGAAAERDAQRARDHASEAAGSGRATDGPRQYQVQQSSPKSTPGV